MNDKNTIQYTQGAYWKRLRKGQHERLVKLCKPAQGGAVLDMTAGLLHDSLILARCGFAVTALEKNPTIWAAVQTALADFSESTGYDDTAKRIEHLQVDALAFSTSKDYAVVYLDPMFPIREKTAAVSKEAQWLQQQEAPATASEEEALLTKARLIASKRVIVKRPPHAPYLAKQTPDFSDAGKAIRYDVYLRHLP